MTPLRVVIADDEPLARERLRQLLRPELGVEVVAECATGRETLAAVARDAPDLVFLDVTMPDLDGLGVTRALPGPVPAVVFVTAHARFALQAFEASAVDFLLKPLDAARLASALGRVRERLARPAVSLTRRLPAAPRPATAGIAARHDGRRVIVRLAEVTWIEADGNYCIIHHSSGRLRRKEPLHRLARRLSPARFLRVSRSTLVNVDHVRELRPKSHGDAVVVLEGGATLLVSRTRRAEVAARLGRA